MCEKYLVQITGKYSMFAENEKEAVQRALKHLESDVGFCVDSPYKAKQVFYIKTEKKQEGEYKRGRVEELKELHNKMCFKHFDSKSMNPERYSAVKEYVEKRLLELQEGEK